MRCRERTVQPPGSEAGMGEGRAGGGGRGAGVMGPWSDYEGGFLLMALDREEAPCPDWHSEDFREKVGP